jgi:hypothetical protein
VIPLNSENAQKNKDDGTEKMSMVEEIKKRRRTNPWFKAGSVTEADVDWLIAEAEASEKAEPEQKKLIKALEDCCRMFKWCDDHYGALLIEVTRDEKGTTIRGAKCGHM